MAIADIITGGFGTFSSVNLIPTRGFSIGASIELDGTIYYSATSTRPLYRAIRMKPQYVAPNSRPFYAVRGQQWS